MIVYLWSLTFLNAAFLLRMELIHWRQLSDFYDQIGKAKDGTTNALGLVALVLDFVQDTVKYLVVAVVLSTISTVVYFSALFRPARWKTYSMLIGGIGFIWIGGELTAESLAGPDGNQTIARFLANDDNSIVLNTLFVIGHVYVLTSIVQFLRAAQHEDFFLDVQEEKARVRLERETRVISVVRAIEAKTNYSYAYDYDYEFEGFWQGLADNDKRLFVAILAGMSDGGKASRQIRDDVKLLSKNSDGQERKEIAEIISTVSKVWPYFRNRYSLA